MGKKIGRPRVPKQEAKNVLVGAQLSPPQAKEAEKRAASQGLDKSKWLRGAIENELKNSPIWFDSKSAPNEMNGKLVEFRLTGPNFRVEGVGMLVVMENRFGQVSVEIQVNYAIDEYTRQFNRYFLPKEFVDNIKPHPDQSIASYKLVR